MLPGLGFTMKNPFAAIRKASRLSQKGQPLAAMITLQRALLSTPKPKPKPKRKRKRSVAMPRQAKAVSGGSRTLPARPQRQVPGSFISGRHEGEFGAIAYRLYTPTGPENRRLPLIVMLHGCNQSATDFATGTGMNALADELGFLVLYPEQSPALNLNRCWNWHRPENQRRGSGEPQTIAALTLHVIRACRANRTRIYIAGISAGGTAAAITAAAIRIFSLQWAFTLPSRAAKSGHSTVRFWQCAKAAFRQTQAKRPERCRPSFFMVTVTVLSMSAMQTHSLAPLPDRRVGRSGANCGAGGRTEDAISHVRITSQLPPRRPARTGRSMAAAMHGPEASAQVRIPILRARMHRAKSCASFWRTGCRRTAGKLFVGDAKAKCGHARGHFADGAAVTTASARWLVCTDLLGVTA